jgi:membrane protease YdiL (CAAX protease family)
MAPRGRLHLALAWQAGGFLVALTLVCTGLVPHADPILAPGLGILAGVGMGVALFAGLTGEVVRPWPATTSSLGSFAVRAGYLGGVAASEEVIWRGLVLALLANPLGWLAALACSSVGFLLVHGPRNRGEASIWGLIGIVFGAAFLLGGLPCAIVAHSAYNLSILAANESERAQESSGLELARGIRGAEVGTIE